MARPKRPASDAQLATKPESANTVTTEESTVDERVNSHTPPIDDTTKSIHKICFLAEKASMDISDEMKSLCKCLKVEIPTDNIFKTLLFARQKKSPQAICKLDPQTTCIVCEGSSIISTIENELKALCKQAKKAKQRKKLKSIQKAILAKATSDAKLIDGKPKGTGNSKRPTTTNTTEALPLDSKQLTNERKLEFHEHETIYPDKHDRIKKAVYECCLVALNQGTKISKKAIFINCDFVFPDGHFKNCKIRDIKI